MADEAVDASALTFASCVAARWSSPTLITVISVLVGRTSNGTEGTTVPVGAGATKETFVGLGVEVTVRAGATGTVGPRSTSVLPAGAGDVGPAPRTVAKLPVVGAGVPPGSTRVTAGPLMLEPPAPIPGLISAMSAPFSALVRRLFSRNL